MENHVHISRSNSKLGADIPSVNLPVGITCRHDAPCFKDCYANKGRFKFKNVSEPIKANYDVWKNNPEEYEKAVVEAAFPNRFFRWHSSGDIPDADYLEMMVRVAEKLPKTDFLCFTKQYEIVNEFMKSGRSVPDNLHIVFSAWGSKWEPYNPYLFPIAYVDLGDGECSIPEYASKCSGFCGNCAMTGCSCWDLKRGDGSCVVFKKH